MGAQNEARSNRRSLDIMREDYDSDNAYKKALNEQMKAMPEELRNKLFENLDDESYMAVSNIYDMDKSYTWRDSIPDIIDENMPETAGAVGLGGVALTALALYKRGKGKEATELIKKNVGTSMGSKKWMTKDPDAYKGFSSYIDDLKKSFYKENGSGKDAKKVADKLFDKNSKTQFNEWKRGGPSAQQNTTKGTGKGGGFKGKQFNPKAKRGDRGAAEGKWENVSKKARKPGTDLVWNGSDWVKSGPTTGSRASDIKYEWMKKQGRILGKNDAVGPVMPGNTGGPGYKPRSQKTGPYEPPVSTVRDAQGNKITVQNKPKKNLLSESQIQDAEFSASKKIPKSKLKLYEQNIKNMNRSGQMSDQEAKIMRDAMRKLGKNGKSFTQGDVVEEILKNPAGKDVIEKVSSGAINSKLGIIGAGVAGAYLGGYIGGGLGSVFGEKGEAVGDIVGTTAGAVGIVPAVNLIVDKVKKQGVKNVMAKITTRLGAKTAMKLMASGIFSGLTSGPTFGLSNLITAGFIASDVYAIYDILNEEE
tara:strand:+ start:8 stop:1606 length:1599 start_codon:yes stop_codon:yes gene_type:complete